ncbi:MAG: inositol monophosphatase [Deltaproteobacteria bacterium]|nr:MAG: inositol monophosphatase [Deltaproteobacteria bacterium]
MKPILFLPKNRYLRMIKTMSDINLKDALDVSIQVSKKAGALLLKYQKRLGKLKTNYKEGQGVVSKADIASENFIIKSLLKKFPQTEVLGEESSFAQNITNYKDVKKNPYTWIIDPLDGTTNFLNGFDYYSVCISLAHFGEPILGVVYRPSNGDLFYALKGKGTRYNKKLIKPKSVRKKLKDALLITGFSTEKGQVFGREFRIFKDLAIKSRGVRRLGSAALDMCYVAQGVFDGFWESNLAPWDVAASGVICLEAGIEVRNLKGENFSPFNKDFVAARPLLMKELLKAFGKKP